MNDMEPGAIADLRSHATFSDGKSSLEALRVRAAEALVVAGVFTLFT